MIIIMITAMDHRARMGNKFFPSGILVKLAAHIYKIGADGLIHEIEPWDFGRLMIHRLDGNKLEDRY